MLNYYTSIILLTWMTLAVLSILIRENNRIAKEEKKAFYLTYSLIACAALAEFIGVCLDGHKGLPKEILLAVKCVDYTLTPMVGVALVERMYRDNPKERRILWAIFIGNMLFQIASSFFGWMVTIDEQNYYSHGPLYFVYVVIYLSVIVLVIRKFIAYGNTFKRKNRTSLYAIMILLLVGAFIQELSDVDLRTVYLTMAVASCLIFIHYTEFTQLRLDDSFSVQQSLLMTDPLTGVKNRHAYSEMLKDYESGQKLPHDLVVFSIDINGLKQVNDTLGHEAGDELVCGAACCIEHIVGGKCFRTGGDEFIVLSRMNKHQAENILHNLEVETGKWSGNLVEKMSLAAGYAMAADHPGCSAEGLIRESDLLMYAAKAAYYQKNGHDRRK